MFSGHQLTRGNCKCWWAIGNTIYNIMVGREFIIFCAIKVNISLILNNITLKYVLFLFIMVPEPTIHGKRMITFSKATFFLTITYDVVAVLYIDTIMLPANLIHIIQRYFLKCYAMIGLHKITSSD